MADIDPQAERRHTEMLAATLTAGMFGDSAYSPAAAVMQFRAVLHILNHLPVPERPRPQSKSNQDNEAETQRLKGL